MADLVEISFLTLLLETLQRIPTNHFMFLSCRDSDDEIESVRHKLGELSDLHGLRRFVLTVTINLFKRVVPCPSADNVADIKSNKGKSLQKIRKVGEECLSSFSSSPLPTQWEALGISTAALGGGEGAPFVVLPLFLGETIKQKKHFKSKNATFCRTSLCVYMSSVFPSSSTSFFLSRIFKDARKDKGQDDFLGNVVLRLQVRNGVVSRHNDHL